MNETVTSRTRVNCCVLSLLGRVNRKEALLYFFLFIYLFDFPCLFCFVCFFSFPACVYVFIYLFLLFRALSLSLRLYYVLARADGDDSYAIRRLDVSNVCDCC